MKCFKHLNALEESCYDLNIFILYIELSVVRSMIYQASIEKPKKMHYVINKQWFLEVSGL